MAVSSDVLETLRASGTRLTPQRVMVIQAIAAGEGHVTAEEIHARVQATYPFIDLATVYRTLQLFKRLRLVTEIDFGEGSARYELSAVGRHHHLVCRNCGGTFDLPLDYLDDLRQSLRREFRFEPDLDHFTLGGVCRSCSDDHPREA